MLEKVKCLKCGEVEFTVVSEKEETVHFWADVDDFVPEVLNSKRLCYDIATCANCGYEFAISELEAGELAH